MNNIVTFIFQAGNAPDRINSRREPLDNHMENWLDEVQGVGTPNISPSHAPEDPQPEEIQFPV